MVSYLQVSGVAGAFAGGWGKADWGVITHASEGKSFEGNEAGRMVPSQRVVRPLLPADIDPPVHGY